MEIGKALLTLIILGVFVLFIRLYNALILKPKKLRAILKGQGINGPPSNFLLGNIKEIRKAQTNTARELTDTHNLSGFIFPFFGEWRNKFGKLIRVLKLMLYIFIFIWQRYTN